MLLYLLYLIIKLSFLSLFNNIAFFLTLISMYCGIKLKFYCVFLQVTSYTSVYHKQMCTKIVVVSLSLVCNYYILLVYICLKVFFTNWNIFSHHFDYIPTYIPYTNFYLGLSTRFKSLEGILFFHFNEYEKCYTFIKFPYT